MGVSSAENKAEYSLVTHAISAGQRPRILDFGKARPRALRKRSLPTRRL